MIIIGRKNSGKRLLRLLTEAMQGTGKAQVACLSTQAVKKASDIGQQLANAIGKEVEAVPETGEIRMSMGHYRAGLIVTYQLKK